MKTILLKLSGETFCENQSDTITSLIEQIKTITQSHRMGIVLGGGNFFRGSKNGTALGLRPTTGHTVGMVATLMNGLILQDLLLQSGVSCSLHSALPCPTIARPIRQELIDNALTCKSCVIFVGGTGNPFFTTDTNGVVRALQIGANELWKGTKVDGVYDADPEQHANAKKFDTITYKDALDKKLGVIDATALTLAEQEKLPIRVFNLFKPNALINALEKPDFGSTIRT